MKKITDTLSKEIVAVREGEIVGIATNVYTDERLTRVRGYKVSNEERDEGDLLPLRRLIGQGDALVVRSVTALEEPRGAECPLGAKIYDTLGVCRGVLRDLLFDEEKGDVLSLITDREEFASDRVISYGKRAVILRAPCHDKFTFRAVSRRPHRQIKRSEDAAVKGPTNAQQEDAIVFLAGDSLSEASAIHPLAAREDLSSEMPSDIPSATKSETPETLPEYAFLLGRTVLKDIGKESAVAKGGEVVTADVIRRARESGKLVELTLNSKKEG